MPNCPICGDEIDNLNYLAKEEVAAGFMYNEDFNDCEYYGWYTIGIADGAKPNYCCPECDEVLFNNEEEAMKFLKSGELPEHRIPYFMERKLSQ